MDAPRPPAVTEQLLRDSGLRVTRARVAVFETLQTLGGHRSADEVLAGIAGEISRATAFNVLEDLSAAGLVMRVAAGPGAVRYEVAGEPHHHFVCALCGKVQDVPCESSSTPCIDPPDVGAVVTSADVIYGGVCFACGQGGN